MMIHTSLLFKKPSDTYSSTQGKRPEKVGAPLLDVSISQSSFASQIFKKESLSPQHVKADIYPRPG